MKGGNPMKLSLIIPVYNVVKYIENTMKSATGQSIQAMEIICVDDRSNDGSWDILCQFAKTDTRIRLFRQERNQGVAAARKLAVMQSTGEYIMFLDGDDTLEENACQDLIEEIEKQQVDILHFGTHVIARGEVTEEERKQFCRKAKPNGKSHQRDELYNSFFVDGCCGF